MARLATAGGEIGLGTDIQAFDGQANAINGGTAPVLQSSVFRSGAAAWKFDSGAGGIGESFCEFGQPQSLDRHYYLRAYWNFPDTTPPTEFNLMTGEDGGGLGSVVAVRLKTDGTLTLSRRVNTAANIGSASAALVNNTWYRIELMWLVSAAGSNSVCELYLNGGLVSTVTGQNFNNTALNRFELGLTTTPGASFITYMDDVAMNDDQGANQNSYPGEGKVVLLKPISDVQAGSWTGGAGGTTNLFDAVNNTPPIGTNAETNLTQIESADTSGNNATDEYRANLTTYTNAGIVAADTIKVLHPSLYAGDDTGAGTHVGEFGGQSNPSWTYDGFAPSGTLNVWDSSWLPVEGTPQYNPTPTLGSSLVLAVRKTDAVASVLSICFMGVHAEYVEGTTPSVAWLKA